MINCPTCEFADFDKDKCTRLLIRLPHVCPYAKEKTPRNHFEQIKSMSMEELADWLGVYCNGQTAQEAGKPCTSGMGSCEECWLDWLKQEAKDD